QRDANGGFCQRRAVIDAVSYHGHGALCSYLTNGLLFLFWRLFTVYLVNAQCLGYGLAVFVAVSADQIGLKTGFFQCSDCSRGFCSDLVFKTNPAEYFCFPDEVEVMTGIDGCITSSCQCFGFAGRYGVIGYAVFGDT